MSLFPALVLTLRWLNTVFDTSVSFTCSSKTLDPLVAQSGSEQVNNTNFNFLVNKLSYIPLHGNMVKFKQALKIGFVYLQKI